MNADGSNQINLTNNDSADDGQPAFSGDGSRIVFTSNRDRDGNSEIYVMNADGSNQTRLTDNTAYDFAPAFSVDGSRIAFHSYCNGNAETYVMNADGSNQTRLTNRTAFDGEPSFGRFEAVPPTAVSDSYDTDEDTTLTVAAPGVLQNDTDADGDTLTAALVSGPSNGTLMLNADGSFTYTPTANYNGTDRFTYKANDGQADSNVATVTITVTPVADFPETPILDTFNRANGKVGSQWEGLIGTDFYRIATNTLDVQAGGPLVWKQTFGTTQEAFVTLSAVDPKSPSQGVLLKVQTGKVPDAGAITVVYDAKAKVVRVSALRVGAKTWTFYPTTSVAFANGDVLGGRVLPNGTVEVYQNDTLVTTVTLSAADQAFFNAKGGKIGIWTLTARNAVLDDFGGGTVTP
jgi:dipeptidyl aminopeptidase/acylaminoacyl peptidase